MLCYVSLHWHRRAFNFISLTGGVQLKFQQSAFSLWKKFQQSALVYGKQNPVYSRLFSTQKYKAVNSQYTGRVKNSAIFADNYIPRWLNCCECVRTDIVWCCRDIRLWPSPFSSCMLLKSCGWTLISLIRTTSSNRKHNLSKTTKQWIINRSRIRSTSNFKICAGTLGSPSWFLAQWWAFEPALHKLLFKSGWSLSSVWTIFNFLFSQRMRSTEAMLWFPGVGWWLDFVQVGYCKRHHFVSTLWDNSILEITSLIWQKKKTNNGRRLET